MMCAKRHTKASRCSSTVGKCSVSRPLFLVSHKRRDTEDVLTFAFKTLCFVLSKAEGQSNAYRMGLGHTVPIAALYDLSFISHPQRKKNPPHALCAITNIQQGVKATHDSP